jgi:hypothetical protein
LFWGDYVSHSEVGNGGERLIAPTHIHLAIGLSLQHIRECRDILPGLTDHILPTLYHVCDGNGLATGGKQHGSGISQFQHFRLFQRGCPLQKIEAPGVGEVDSEIGVFDDFSVRYIHVF